MQEEKKYSIAKAQNHETFMTLLAKHKDAVLSELGHPDMLNEANWILLESIKESTMSDKRKQGHEKMFSTKKKLERF